MWAEGYVSKLKIIFMWLMVWKEHQNCLQKTLVQISGSVGCQTLNFFKVTEPCISSKVGLSICPLNLTIAVKFKIDLVYIRVRKMAKCYKIGSQAHLEAHRKKHKDWESAELPGLLILVLPLINWVTFGESFPLDLQFLCWKTRKLLL